MNFCVAKTTHKYRMQVPCTVAEAIKLDVVNDNNLWGDVLDSIVDYQKLNNAVDKADQYLTTKKGTKQMRQTTEGWNLLVS